ncbi:hypothetical protein HO133_005199 [Letharia lupina]|uniref:Uncharacterized protein n=1 Tax=Letharia lupina TaxID=560253 RepID=A0A8H6C9C3_9LECA|nr:uncharacterized protein HO133_005199 [Letharia lupina]KAF6219373.1 hypothetical protein HO133_005199 [Letharia lupina]
MPPQRTIPPAKALKTERTHEENQERAYIAASRRSDRSLEARVESARRASEIHKRRTGRSLRVTEQDVVNEEMYEEEDDDLPMQYRRLTAHLQTGSADFNRRLSAYLTNHVAMRSALDQAITNSYAQQYPNAPQFAHNQNIYPSPFMAHKMPQQQSPSFGQPYPTPGTPGYRPSHQARSASGSHGTPTYSPNMPAPSPIQAVPQMDRRRTSASSKSSSHSPTGQPVTPQSMHAMPALPQTSSTSNVKQEGQTSQQMRAPQQPSPVQRQHSFGAMNGFSNMSPFTTSLPTEAQMLLGPALDPNDSFTSMLMAGSEALPQSYNYNTTPSTFQKPRSFNQSYDGMSATLAPSALDMSPRHQIYAQPSTTISASPASSPAFQLPYDASLHDFSKCQIYAGGNSASGSGTVTPAGIDGGWDAFINDTSWTENTT